MRVAAAVLVILFCITAGIAWSLSRATNSIGPELFHVASDLIASTTVKEEHLDSWSPIVLADDTVGKLVAVARVERQKTGDSILIYRGLLVASANVSRRVAGGDRFDRRPPVRARASTHPVTRDDIEALARDSAVRAHERSHTCRGAYHKVNGTCRPSVSGTYHPGCKLPAAKMWWTRTSLKSTTFASGRRAPVPRFVPNLPPEPTYGPV